MGISAGFDTNLLFGCLRISFKLGTNLLFCKMGTSAAVDTNLSPESLSVAVISITLVCSTNIFVSTPPTSLAYLSASAASHAKSSSSSSSSSLPPPLDDSDDDKSPTGNNSLRTSNGSLRKSVLVTLGLVLSLRNILFFHPLASLNFLASFVSFLGLT